MTNSAPTSVKVAFIGLGHMGLPMAVNLIAAGHQVSGFDVSEQAREQATAQEVGLAITAQDAVADADVVITMLPNGKLVLDCYGGTDASPSLLAAARPGTLFIDCSTIATDDARAANRLATEAGHRSVDAPVSGGVVGATAGTLTLMVGATDEDFSSAYPILSAVGKRIVHCGAPGTGQAAKICNNMILGVSMIAVSEAFVLGKALGLTPKALFDVASNASGQCWALTTNCPVPDLVPTSPANNDYKPGFAAALMAKDLNLASQAADSRSVDTAFGHLAARTYDNFVERGGGTMDFSAIIRAIGGDVA